MAKRKGHSLGSLNRRNFLALAAAGTVSMATGWPEGIGECATVPETSHGNAQPLDAGGIAPEHFENARKRATEMVSKLTLSEKISQFSAQAPAVPRVGLPAFNYQGEALHGLIHDGPVTSFPLPLALGCSWNRSLIEQVFAAVSDEVWAWHKKDGPSLQAGLSLAVFSPVTVNMGTRDPRWGRIGENYSEDPYLVGQMAIYTVHGMQGHDSRYLKTIVCAKHFIANETENDRKVADAAVDSRSFWEYYSRGFEACVRQGQVFSVMSSYNAMNGIPTSANRFLLTELLRERWGFRGYVVSDCGALDYIFDKHHFGSSYADAAALAVNAGGSINCGTTLEKHLGEAVDEMLIDEFVIGDALIRAFTGRVLLGEFDPPGQNPYSAIPTSCLESPEHQQLAREAARQSIVLFKNANSTLPLDKGRIKRIAVIGPMADVCQLGNYSGGPKIRISPLQGIKEYFGVAGAPAYYRSAYEAVQIEGGPRVNDFRSGNEYLDGICNGSWAAFSKVLFDGATTLNLRVSSMVDGGSIEVHMDGLNGPLIAKLDVPNTGDWQNYVTVSAPIAPVSGDHMVYLLFLGGQGKLFTFRSFNFTPVKPIEGPLNAATKVMYALGCNELGEKEPPLFAEAVDAARASDVVLVFVGADQVVDKESHDRSDINLPGPQHELVQAVFAANPRTILVISSNCPVAVNWEQNNLPAIVGGMFLGQEQGHALTDVLFGDYNPGGKLNTTWFRRVEDLPDFHDYNIRHGRTYMYFKGTPLYPFGHGLSYTTFEYKDLRVSDTTLRPAGKIAITFQLTNVGNREGDEIAQLYVRLPGAKIERPIKQLVNFDRVRLKASETRAVSFELAYEDQSLQYWDETKAEFAVDAGPLEVMIGASSTDIRLKEGVHLSS